MTKTDCAIISFKNFNYWVTGTSYMFNTSLESKTQNERKCYKWVDNALENAAPSKLSYIKNDKQTSTPIVIPSIF